MQTKIEKFTEQMQAFFGEPRGEIAGLLGKHLAEFDEPLLLAVAEHFALTRKYKTWPMPVEIIAACKDKAAASAPPVARNAGKDDAWAHERTDRADRLILCDMGVEAREQGWLDALWHFCRKNERLPDRHEAVFVQQQAERDMRTIDSALARIADDSKWPATKRGFALREKLLDFHKRMEGQSARRADRVAEWSSRNRMAA